MGANLILPAGGAAAAAAAYTVENSCRFWGPGAVGLNRTFGTPTNQGIWTFSGWWKNIHEFGDYSGGLFLQASNGAYNANVASYPDFAVRLYTTDEIYIHNYTGSAYNLRLTSNEKFRDPGAWCHVVYSYEYNVGSGDTFKMWVNNKRVTWRINSVGFPSSIGSLQVNHDPSGAENHAIGVYGYNQPNQTNTASQLADVHFIDGQAKIPSDFAETDSNGQWVPKEYTGDDYGNNGFHLDFSDSSDLGADAAGSNDFTAAGLLLGSHDQMLDSPSAGKNYCTFNPLDRLGSAITLSEGNLHSHASSVAYGQAVTGRRLLNWYIETGTWLVEFRLGPDTYSNAQMNNSILIGRADGASEYCSIYDSATAATGSGLSVTGTAGNWADEDIIGLAIDFDSGTRTVKVYHNGTLTSTVSGFSVNEFYIQNGVYGTSGSPGTESWLNCGQDPTFSGTHTTSEAEFAYPIEGYNALCTANLPAPGLNNAVDDEKAFETVTWAGTGVNENDEITVAAGFDPDLIWTKTRNLAQQHVLVDSVRGGSGALWYKTLSPDTDTAESETRTYGEITGNTDGFTAEKGTNSDYDFYNEDWDYVGWLWKAGSTATDEAFNASAGFSIVKYTGTWDAGYWSGDNPQSVSHSLGVAPELMLIKDRDNSGSWVVYHKDLDTASGEYLVLDTDAAVETSMSDDPFYGESPTNSVFKVASDSSGAGAVDINTDSTNYIAYLFASVEGYSKVGSYTGNTGSKFVYLGFRPAFIIIKRDGVNDWQVIDCKREGYNPQNDMLFPSLAWDESNVTDQDLLSNGFMLRTSGLGRNQTGHTYFFYAVAENPFKYANAR
jgi:hypothetical protein